MRDPFLPIQRLDPTTTKVQAALAQASPNIRFRLQAELDRFRKACGCGTGAIGALLGLMLMSLWQITGFTHWNLVWIAAACGKILATALAGALAGKLLGLGWARARFRRVTARLLEEIHV